MNTRILCIALAGLLALSSCDFISDIISSKDKQKPLPGKRIEVLSDNTLISPDPSLTGVEVTVPEAISNDSWQQAAGSAQGITGNLQFSGIKEHDKVSIGKGFEWEQPLYTAPIIAANMIFVMDSAGYITAHDLANIKTVKWKSKSLVNKDKPEVLGGGLAYDAPRLYVTSGRGIIVAIDVTSGKELWRQSMGVPLRAAPKANNGKVYAVSVDNQLFAFDGEKGTQLWSHRGINENAGFLAEISPAVTDTLVIAPYSSGEIHALDSVSGQDLWNDSLLKPNRTNATAEFSGIAGNPIIKDDIVYAAGSNGFTAAFSLLTGRGIWEQDIPSLNTPWIAGDFLYMISSTNQLVCIYKADGRIKWVRQLSNFRNEKRHKDAYSWIGPLMAGGQLLVFESSHGIMLALSPKDGSDIKKTEIPEDITVAPIIAGGRMYLVTKDAKLHVLY